MRQIDLLREWKQEVDSFTLELVKTIGVRNIDQKPFEKISELKNIVCHLAESEIELVSKLADDNSNDRKVPEHSEIFNVETCRKYLKEVFQYSDSILQGITDQDLARESKLTNENGPVTFLAVIRMIIEHQIHHRGQIVVALEALDVDLPKRWDDYKDKIQ